MSVTVVGLGADGPAGLGERALAAVRTAELLAGGKRHLAFFAEHPAEKLAITSNLDEVAAHLGVAADRRCVVLASGDPCFFGIGPLLVEWLGRERVEIIPGVSSVALAFARLGLAWQDARVLSAHGRALTDLIEPARQGGKLAFLTDATNTPAAIGRVLLAAGLADCPAYVFEHLGGAGERLIETSLAELPSRQFAALNVLVVLAGPNPAAPSGVSLFGRPESDFRQLRGQITKAEARAISLAKLRLPAAGILWDIGAGAGSLSIEAAGLMPKGAVFAVERDASQLHCLLENIRRTGATPVRPIHGAAPAALEGLARPDRVFIGGAGRALAEIIDYCLRTCTAAARIVVNAATLETVGQASACFHGAGWQTELVQVSVSRGRLIGGRTRLEALNPIFILSAWPATEGPAAAP